jgi:hypothetical protein
MNPLLPLITAARWLWFLGLLLAAVVVVASFLGIAWVCRLPRKLKAAGQNQNQGKSGLRRLFDLD